MNNHRRLQEYRICKKNHEFLDIIPLTEDNDARPPTVAPVSDDTSSFDSSLGRPHIDSEGCFSLTMLTMGRQITHFLLLRFHPRHSLHLQILLKRGFYPERDIMLIPGSNASANNGLNHFGNKVMMRQ